jgi:hypothetical protein
MAFTYVLTTDIGKVRFEIGDYTLNTGVRPGGVNFTDEEITAVLTEESNEILATVIRLMDVLSREWAIAVDITLGPRKEAFSQVSKHYADLAARLRDDQGAGSAGTNLRFNRQDGYRRAHETGQYGYTVRHWHHDFGSGGEF